MKTGQRLLCILFAVLLLASSVTPLVLAANGNVTVYVTNTGTVYHRRDCTYLKSSRAVTLEWAIRRGYTPCTRCDPPILGDPQEDDWDAYIQPEPERPSSASPGKGTGSTGTGNRPSTTPADPEEPGIIGTIASVAIVVLFFGPLFLAFVVAPVLALVDRVRDRKRLIAQAQLEAQQKEDYDRKRAELLEKYAHKSLDDFAPIPPGVTFDAAGLPVGPGRGKWGRDYTFYRSRKGKAYHLTSTCTRGANIPVHALQLRGLQPCRRCKPLKPDLKWYYKREAVKKECRLYNIPIPEHAPQIEPPPPPESEQLRLF